MAIERTLEMQIDAVRDAIPHLYDRCQPIQLECMGLAADTLQRLKNAQVTEYTVPLQPDENVEHVAPYAEQLMHFGISKHMWGGLTRYLVEHIRPGDFLQAVIAGDLFQATIYADDENITVLHGYARFLLHNAPAASWGSYKKLDEWVTRRD